MKRRDEKEKGKKYRIGVREICTRGSIQIEPNSPNQSFQSGIPNESSNHTQFDQTDKKVSWRLNCTLKKAMERFRNLIVSDRID